MRVQTFLFRTVLGFLLAMFSIAQCMAAEPEKSQVYELRVYITKSEQQQKAVVEHWERSGIPAYNRINVKPVAVLTELQPSETNRVYVLLPFDSADAFSAAPAKLLADSAYQKSAAEFLNLHKTNAAFERIESSLLVAFDGMKKLSPPPATGDRASWVFELRTYMSASENRGWNKIKMFNAGEITVMKETGLSPVFFAQNLTGSQLPCLTYMTCGENMEEHQKHWKTFGNAPGWNALKDDPQYKDNMTGMIKLMLKRTAASQL